MSRYLFYWIATTADVFVQSFLFVARAGAQTTDPPAKPTFCAVRLLLVTKVGTFFWYSFVRTVFARL
jgi:hypothetical protein